MKKKAFQELISNQEVSNHPLIKDRESRRQARLALYKKLGQSVKESSPLSNNQKDLFVYISLEKIIYLIIFPSNPLAFPLPVIRHLVLQQKVDHLRF